MERFLVSLQECLASRKDCSGEGLTLSLNEIEDICKSTSQVVPSNRFFIILPDGNEYNGGIYRYFKGELSLLSEQQKTKYTLELYPELHSEDPIKLEDLVRVGIIWQYLSLKAENMGLGVSQRARAPKKHNKLVNSITNENHSFLYSVAVRKRDKGKLLEDQLKPLEIVPEKGTILLDTPLCYRDRAIYTGKYKGVSLEKAIYNQVERKTPNFSALHEISQLLWACEGETDHSTHGNRDGLEKNGYGRVHASGCAGYAIYPIVFVEDLADIPKGTYIYNPVGYSTLNRWLNFNGEIVYDHFLRKWSDDNFKTKLESEFGIENSNYIIMLCVDRKKPCAGFSHKIMKLKYWAEVEAGMALAGLQLQANALGLKWNKVIISNPDEPRYRNLFLLDKVENMVNYMAESLIKLTKNERLSLKGNLIPAVIFYTE